MSWPRHSSISFRVDVWWVNVDDFNEQLLTSLAHTSGNKIECERERESEDKFYAMCNSIAEYRCLK